MKLEEIISNYDALIVDLWGVVHDGDRLYPGVAETLAVLRELNKPVLFLSNAPRVSAKAQVNLDRLAIPRSHYLDVVTSGQVAHDLLARSVASEHAQREKSATHSDAGKAFSPKGGEGWMRGPNPGTAATSTAPHLSSPPVGERDASRTSSPHIKRYFYLGPGKDEDILGDLTAYEQTDDAAHANFILCTGYEVDGQPHEEIIPLLAQLLHLPMLCVNPDMEVVKQDGYHQLCAGAVAAEFTKMGGKVAYIGKPFPEVYQVCKLLLGNSRVLCVGDNPATDIKGANDAGFDSLLVTGGVLKARYGDAIGEAEAREICSIAGVTPTYVLGGFGL